MAEQITVLIQAGLSLVQICDQLLASHIRFPLVKGFRIPGKKAMAPPG